MQATEVQINLHPRNLINAFVISYIDSVTNAYNLCLGPLILILAFVVKLLPGRKHLKTV